VPQGGTLELEQQSDGSTTRRTVLQTTSNPENMRAFLAWYDSYSRTNDEPPLTPSVLERKSQPPEYFFFAGQVLPPWISDAASYVDTLGQKVRVAVEQDDPKTGAERWKIIEQDRGAFALRIFITRVMPPNLGFAYPESFSQPTPFPASFAVRSTTVTIPNADSASLASTETLTSLASDKVWLGVWNRARKQSKGSSPNETLEFVYPPGPPTRGVNVFGDISRVSFPTNRAAISVKGVTHSYRTPSTVMLTGALFEPTRDRSEKGLHVPFQINGRQATLDARLKGEVSVDGKVIPVSHGGWIVSAFSRLNDERLGYWIGIAGLFVTVLTLVLSRERLRADT
jgi:hypothetical protein